MHYGNEGKVTQLDLVGGSAKDYFWQVTGNSMKVILQTARTNVANC
jgi:hypothetical protein